MPGLQGTQTFYPLNGGYEEMRGVLNVTKKEGTFPASIREAVQVELNFLY